MENGRGQGRIGTPRAEYLDEMFRHAGASRRNYGNINCVNDRGSQFAIEAAAGSVPVNRGEHYFAGSVLLGVGGPFHRFAPGGVPASGGLDPKEHAIAVGDPESINRNDDSLG